MRYILSSQVNGLSSTFRDNPLDVLQPLLKMFHAKHPDFFETLDYMDEEWKASIGNDPWYGHIILVEDQPCELKLDNMDLRRNPDFISLMESLPVRNFATVEIPDDVEVWLQQGDAGGEWLCEAHRTWHDRGNMYG